MDSYKHCYINDYKVCDEIPPHLTQFLLFCQIYKCCYIKVYKGMRCDTPEFNSDLDKCCYIKACGVCGAIPPEFNSILVNAFITVFMVLLHTNIDAFCGAIPPFNFSHTNTPTLMPILSNKKGHQLR